MLSESFLEQYRNCSSNFEGPGQYVFLTKIRRRKDNGDWETWCDVVQRVVDGLYWKVASMKGVNQRALEREAEQMFIYIYHKCFLPSGQNLRYMGLPISKKTGAVLYNCAFVSTKNIDKDFAEPFAFMLDFLLLGVGVGSDIRGVGKVRIRKPQRDEDNIFVLEDSREGWVSLLTKVLNSFVGKDVFPVNIDYSQVRAEGSRIAGLGINGFSIKPFQKMIDDLCVVLHKNIGKLITITTIADMVNIIGRCVNQTDVRRAAQILLGFKDQQEFLDLKNYEKNAERLNKWGYMSNDSVILTEHETLQTYRDLVNLNKATGNPGFFWLNNAKQYGRMYLKALINSDSSVEGCNPCGEISLGDMGLCNIVEVFPANFGKFDPEQIFRFATKYAKYVTFFDIHHVKADFVAKLTRRIGVCLGAFPEWMNEVTKAGKKDWAWEQLIKWYDVVEKEDIELSTNFRVPVSIKRTSVKPSGTISFLANTCHGVHYPLYRYYYRTFRCSSKKIADSYKSAGHRVEKSNIDGDVVYYIYFPCKVDPSLKVQSEVSLEEQFNNVVLLQNYWSDNQVSVSIYYKHGQEEEMAKLLCKHQGQLKSLSIFPVCDNYDKQGLVHCPIQEIDEAQYNKSVKNIKGQVIDFDGGEDGHITFCDNEQCVF